MKQYHNINLYTFCSHVSLHRYNIIVLERDYAHFNRHRELLFNADIIVGSVHCIVLLPSCDLINDWDVDLFARKLVALGLQFSFCFILVHSIGIDTRWLYFACIMIRFVWYYLVLKNDMWHVDQNHDMWPVVSVYIFLEWWEDVTFLRAVNSLSNHLPSLKSRAVILTNKLQLGINQNYYTFVFICKY